MSTMTPPLTREDRQASERVMKAGLAFGLTENRDADSFLDASTSQSCSPAATTTELVLSAQRGNRDALGELFARYEGQVMAVALRRLHDHGEAQELCQDVFVQAMLKINQLREPEAFGGWLRAIARRMAVNRLTRRRAVQGMDPETLESQWGDELPPDQQALAAERDASVRVGLSRLGSLDRETLVAFYVEGQSLVEMSDGFQAPLGTIKRRLHVARKRLAKQMESLVAV